MLGLGLKTATLVKAGVAALAVVALLCATFFYFGKREGVAETEAGATARALSRIQSMEKTNASFRSLPGRDRCLLLMRDSGLSDSACD